MSEDARPDPGQEPAGYDDLAAAILGTPEVAVFENCYVAYAPEARRLAQAILGDPELAADAVHNGFLEVLRQLISRRRSYDPADTRALVLRNVRWAALKVHRSRRRHEAGSVPAAGDTSDDAAWARAEARALCDQIVAHLRVSHRQALSLHFAEGLSNIEAAGRLGVTVGVFESRLQRAIGAARRAARARGLIPQMAFLAAGARRGPVRARRRVPVPSPRPVAGWLVAATSVTVGLHAAGDVVDRETAPPPQPAPLRLAVAAVPEPQPDSIDDALVLDAVAAPARVVTVLAQGVHCGCLELVRSDDGGASWNVVAGPSAFAAGQSPISAGSGRHAQPCDAAGTRSVYCFGHSVVAQPDGSGSVLRLDARRLLFFAPLSGVLCSTDGGVRWATRCTPISPQE